MNQATQKTARDMDQRARRTSIVNVTNEDYQMSIEDRLVIWTGSGTNDKDILLPPVAQAAGMIFSIIAELADTAQVTVDDAGDDTYQTQAVLDVDKDSVTYYSNGVHWVVVELIQGT